MNRRELIQALLGTAPAIALTKHLPVQKDEDIEEVDGLLMPAMTIPPVLVELRQATDHTLLFSCPLDPAGIIITEPGDAIHINLKIEID